MQQVRLLMADDSIANNPHMTTFLPWLLTDVLSNALTGNNLASLSRTERQSLRNIFREPSLKPIEDITLQRPYAALHLICSTRYLQFLDPDLHGRIGIEKVADLNMLEEMCLILGRLCYRYDILLFSVMRNLANYVLYSSSKKTRKLAIKTIYLVGRLDRYCLKAAQSGLEKASDTESYNSRAGAFENIWKGALQFAFLLPPSHGQTYFITFVRYEFPHGGPILAVVRILSLLRCHVTNTPVLQWH